MKKVLSLKKLSKNELKQIIGSGRDICCQTYCGTDQCSFMVQFPEKCPDLEACA